MLALFKERWFEIGPLSLCDLVGTNQVFVLIFIQLRFVKKKQCLASFPFQRTTKIDTRFIVPDFKVTAFIPSATLRGEGNFGMLVVVENITETQLPNVVVLAGDQGWGESEEIGGIPAHEGRRANLNLLLKEAGEWVIPIWVGCDEEGKDGWKGVITTGVDPEKDYGVKNVTLIGQQITGEKSGMGSVNENQLNIEALANVLDQQTKESIHKGFLVPVEVQLEQRDSRNWLDQINTMRRSNDPKPEPVAPTVNVTVNTPPALEPSPTPSQKDDIVAAAHDTNQRMALAGMVALGGIALILVAALLLLLFKRDEDSPLPPEDKKADETEKVVEHSQPDDSTLPKEERSKMPRHRAKPELVPTPVLFRRVETQVVRLSVEDGDLLVSPVPSSNHLTSLQLGEHYGVKVQLKSPGYLRIFSTQVDGRLWQVYPNQFHASERFEVGEYLFPDPSKGDREGNPLTIQATEVTLRGHTEQMLIQWSQKPFPDQLFAYEQGSSFPFAVRGTSSGSLRVKQEEEQEIEYVITR